MASGEIWLLTAVAFGLVVAIATGLFARHQARCLIASKRSEKANRYSQDNDIEITITITRKDK